MKRTDKNDKMMMKKKKEIEMKQKKIRDTKKVKLSSIKENEFSLSLVNVNVETRCKIVFSTNSESVINSGNNGK